MSKLDTDSLSPYFRAHVRGDWRNGSAWLSYTGKLILSFLSGVIKAKVVGSSPMSLGNFFDICHPAFNSAKTIKREITCECGGESWSRDREWISWSK